MGKAIGWIVGGVVLVLLAGGGLMAGQMFDVFGTRARGCERALTAAIAQVPGVTAVQVECNLQFGGGWQRQKVQLSAASEVDAYPVVEQVLRAMAKSADIEDVWSTPQIYELASGSVLHSLQSLGFNGTPSVRDVRAHYGIQPAR